MAITARTPKLLFSIGTLQRLCIYAIPPANTSDTVQVSTEFGNVLAANTFWIPSTGTSASGVCTVASNTLITLSPTSITVDTGWLVVMGASIAQ